VTRTPSDVNTTPQGSLAIAGVLPGSPGTPACFFSRRSGARLPPGGPAVATVGYAQGDRQGPLVAAKAVVGLQKQRSPPARQPRSECHGLQ